MVTTIQVNERTLLLLKKLKEETQSDSYDEAINKIAGKIAVKKSLAGFLGKYYKKQKLKDIVMDLRDKNDRY
ncbi:hypothetical protein HYV50_05050 [Candidatus Pacearchaeota archaeon]|nr:hypothetical protein [Candidatus Pacearchaeota archaeon]